MLEKDFKTILNEDENITPMFRIHWVNTANKMNDMYPEINKPGLVCNVAKQLARDLYKKSHGRFINIEVKRDV